MENQTSSEPVHAGISFPLASYSRTRGLRRLGMLLIVLVVGCFIFSTADYGGVTYDDTAGYYDVAKNGFASEEARLRPLLYPLLLKAAMAISPNHPNTWVVIIQLLFYYLSFLTLVILLTKISFFKTWNSFIICIILAIAMINPQSLHANSVILPEIIPLFFVILALYYSATDIKKFHSSILYGFLIIIPILFKPVWIFLVVFPIIKLAWVKRDRMSILRNTVFPVVITFAIFALHQNLINHNIRNGHPVSSTMDICLNLTLIRCGCIQGAENTVLYNHLSKIGQVESISSRKWNNSAAEYNDFTRIKNDIPWRIREDSRFWQKSLQNPKNVFTYAKIQLGRVTKFYTTSASETSIQLKSDFQTYAYQGFYNKIHKTIVFPLFVLSFISIICHKHPKIILVFWIFTLLGSIILTFLTFQDSLFLRMRALIEVFLFSFLRGLLQNHQPSSFQS